MPSFWAELATIEGRKWAEISSFMHEATLASIRRLNLSTVSQFQITYGNMKCTTCRAADNVLHFIFHSNVIYNYVLDTIHWNPVFDCISPHYPRPWVILSIEAHLTCISDTTQKMRLFSMPPTNLPASFCAILLSWERARMVAMQVSSFSYPISFSGLSRRRVFQQTR